jgi:tripartite-type tricarboxylate transporter receptor subunit TctC
MTIYIPSRPDTGLDAAVKELIAPSEANGSEIPVVPVTVAGWHEVVEMLSDPKSASYRPFKLALLTVGFPSPPGTIPNPNLLSPIRQIATMWYGAVALASSPWNNLLDWFSYSSNPPRCYAAVQGSPASRAMDRVAAERQIALRFVPMPYDGAKTLLMSKQCEVAIVEGWENFSADTEHFKFLGVLSGPRPSTYASVPTAHDTSMVAGEAYGIVGPVGLPGDVVNQLDNGFEFAAEMALHKKALERANFTPFPLDSRAYASALRRAYADGTDPVILQGDPSSRP